MTVRYIPLVVLLFLLGSCTDTGSSSRSSFRDRLPVDKEYTIVEGRPLGVYNSLEVYRGYRLQFMGDSVRVYHPFERYSDQYRAYEADTTQRYSDSLYMTYSMAADSSLYVMIRSSEGKAFPQRYILTERLDLHPLPASLDGKTYEFRLDGTSYLLYFQAFDFTRAGAETALSVFDFVLKPEASRLVKQKVDFGMPIMPRADTTISVNIGGSRGLVHASAGGEPRIYLASYAAESGPPSGPHKLLEYPSPVPEQLSQNDLLDLLNRGRITTRQLGQEPDSVGIQFAYEADFERMGGMEKTDLDRLDFEFRADSTYSIFVGNRQLTKGHWELSADRNFIKSAAKVFTTDMLHLIQSYGPETISFPVLLKIKTERPKGVELLSYYKAEVMVSFTLDDENS